VVWMPSCNICQLVRSVHLQGALALLVLLRWVGLAPFSALVTLLLLMQLEGPGTPRGPVLRRCSEQLYQCHV
jgi:hypothetical protein